MTDIKTQIRQFVLENAQSKGIKEVSDTDSLTELGIIDSLGIFRLVSFLEDNFNVRIGDEEIVTDNFQTVNEIERFVAAKQAAKGEKTASR
jgi:acyl carrier protein